MHMLHSHQLAIVSYPPCGAWYCGCQVRRCTYMLLGPFSCWMDDTINPKLASNKDSQKNRSTSEWLRIPLQQLFTAVQAGVIIVYWYKIPVSKRPTNHRSVDCASHNSPFSWYCGVLLTNTRIQS
ncbi:unknown protein [Seminavis robusta]|uniref:Uncharacterized protein n=1 Tax=Seminavis robusta TaxID=568900 RepID=A0A9N8H6H0_9STRA|nr:unknown protein [Seminavis robusta]|eukprot:Sro112_g055471.1  (125) ;mRNA; f:2899-3273